MHLLFIKIHLIIFEVISTLIFLFIFGALFYFSIIYKNFSAMKDEKNIKSLDISFSARFSKGVFADVDVKIFPRNEIDKNQNDKYLNATILYNQANYKGKSEKEIINEISSVNPYNIFLFEDSKIATNFKHRLLSLRTESSSFNLTLFALISLFLIFIKITLLKDTYLRLKKIKSSKSDGKNEVYTNLLAQIHPEEYALNTNEDDEKKNLYYNPVLSFINPINVYYYIVFHLTISIIMPSIFPSYTEIYISSYFGFMPNMYFSIYYARSLFGKKLLEENNLNLENFIILRNVTNRENFFIRHDFLNLNDYVPTNTNPYVINLLIMCGSIWLGQFFHPFDTKGSVKIADVDLKKSKVKKYVRGFAIFAVFCIWGFFMVSGLLYEIDAFYLFHRLIHNSSKKILDVKILFFILLFYYHIVFYVIMIIYTYQTHAKNKRYQGNQRIVYTWFS